MEKHLILLRRTCVVLVCLSLGLAFEAWHVMTKAQAVIDACQHVLHP